MSELLKTATNGQWSLEKSKDDDTDRKIKEQMLNEMNRRGVTGQDVNAHLLDIDESVPAETRAKMKRDRQAKKQREQIKVVKNENCSYHENGQWSLTKDNSVKPFGENIYNETANRGRKMNRTGQEHEGLGRNVAVKEWASGGRPSTKQSVAQQAKIDQKKSAKNPVKVYTEEEKAALQAKMEATANAKKP